MKTNTIKSLLFAVFCGFYAIVATAATSFFSDYGQIQNVQNYSTNPFWSPNSPYNQRMPQPVYIQGTDLGAEDCFPIVQSLVSVQCMARDNCKNTQLSEIRPEIMVQLSKLPGNNYVSACAGYLDGVFESYVEQYGNAIPNRPTPFPNATVPNPDLNDSKNIQTPPQQPQWQIEMQERADELSELQRQNSGGDETLTQTDFPATIADLSFSARQQLERDSIEPYKDLNAYTELNIKNLEQWCSDGANAKSPECRGYTKTTARSTSGKTNTDSLDIEEEQLVQIIVDFLEPQNAAERDFFTALATDYVKQEDKDHSLMLDNSFVYDFLSKDKILEKYKQGLLNLTGVKENDDLKIYLDWDEILIQISTVFDATLRRYGALVCENNRSWQVSIDTAMWVGTAVAAIASFGAGGVAAASGRVALGTGLKALAKGASAVGLKTAGKTMSKAGSKQLAKAAVKVGLKNNMRGWVNYKGKGVAKRVAKQAGKNLAEKKNRLLLSGAVAGAIYETAGKPIIAKNQKGKKKGNAAGKLYSLVESKVSTDIVNCQDLDYGEGCYMVCGYGQPDDDLNVKVFKPILNTTFCVSPDDYTLYDTKTNKPLMLNQEQFDKVVQTLKDDVADKGKRENWWKTVTNQRDARHGCDWNEDDIDVYFGSYIYDPDTMEPSSNIIIEQVVRVDD